MLASLTDIGAKTACSNLPAQICEPRFKVLG